MLNRTIAVNFCCPDHPAETGWQPLHANRLKYHTTARVRASIGTDEKQIFASESIHDWAFIPVCNPGYLTKLGLMTREKDLAEFSPHFKTHYTEAVRAIREVFDYDLETETNVENPCMLIPSPEILPREAK